MGPPGGAGALAALASMASSQIRLVNKNQQFQLFWPFFSETYKVISYYFSIFLREYEYKLK